MNTTYPTESQLEEICATARSLRRGHKLQGNRKPYTVIVDDEHHYFSTTTTLLKFLSGCFIPQDLRIFRNFDKGVTINLDA